MILFHESLCSWCNTPLKTFEAVDGEEVVLEKVGDDFKQDRYQNRPDTSFCPNPDCSWYFAMPEKYEAEPGWEAMDACWRI